MSKISIRAIRDLKFDRRNANRGTQRGTELLDRSLSDFGMGRSVLVDRKGHIIAGNKTVEAARRAGYERVVVVPSDGKTLIAVQRQDLDIGSKKARALAIADNRTSEVNLAWDVQSLVASDVDLKQFWNEKELEDLFAQETSDTTLEAPAPKIDQAAALERKWKVTRGQLWEIGPHRLMCADCTSVEDVARLMGKQKGRMCATDPPYLVSYDAKNHPSKNFSDGKNKDWKGRYADKQKNEPLRPFYESFLQQALAVCDSAAAFYIWHASQRQIEVEAAMRASGLLVHQQIIWAKNKPVLTHCYYMWQHEPCFFGWRKGFKPRRKSGEFPTTVWHVDVPVLPGHQSRHPTEKPLELFAGPIRMHTVPGDVVYEPFSGSGTQLAAAENLHRRCYAMEIEPGFVAVALERLNEMGLVPKLLKPHSQC